MLSQTQLVKAQKIIEASYQGRCVVTTYQKQRKADHSTEFAEKVLYDNIPCRLSFESISQATGTNNANAVTQNIKLFVSPNYDIPPGCKIRVTQGQFTAEYKSSGLPSVYPTHQEIILERFDRWA